MSAHTTTGRAIVAGGAPPSDAGARRVLLLAAPLAAVAVGIAAEWLDAGAMRGPLLLLVAAGVVATAHALTAVRRRGWRPFLLAVAVGIATWAAAQTLYVAIHVVRSEPFEAERFGPQPVQALSLIAAHGLLLGAPTGAVAGALLALTIRTRPPAAG